MNKVRVNLFTSYYYDSFRERQRELDYCLIKNSDVGFDSVNLLIEEKDMRFYKSNIKDRFKVNVKTFATRPDFNDFFDAITDNEAINIVTNSDIYFEDLDAIRNYVMSSYNREKLCLALSRWDLINGEKHHFNRPDSQDTWIFYGVPKCHASHSYYMGMAGCDNRLAHDLHQQGFSVVNPSKSIKAIHVHATNIRHYLDVNGNVINRVPPPYMLVPTS